jgi:CRP/FNR family transcriptional regulator, anaerobic regulatory protein
MCGVLNMGCTNTYCFSNVTIFNHLPNDDMKKIAEMIRSKTYSKGEIIVHATNDQPMLLVVKKGRAKVERLYEDGTSQVICFLEQGEFYGESTIFQHQPPCMNVEALDQVEICMLDGARLKQFLVETPEVLFKMLNHVSMRMHELENRLSVITKKEVDARVATFLLQYAKNGEISKMLSKKDIASLLGTTRESVSRKLSDFHKKQYIIMDKHEVKLLNVHALQQIANE